MGFPSGASGKQPACQRRRCKRRGFDPWVGKIRWRRKWQPTPVFLPGESHGQRSLTGYSPEGCKESDTTEETKQAHAPPEIPIKVRLTLPSCVHRLPKSRSGWIHSIPFAVPCSRVLGCNTYPSTHHQILLGPSQVVHFLEMS